MCIRDSQEDRSLKAINYLIDNGASVHISNQYGVTPLLCAAVGNTNPEVITAILEAGANIEHRARGGYTALMYAAALNSNEEVLSTLVNSGADINALCEAGTNALSIATNPKTIATLKALGAVEINED